MGFKSGFVAIVGRPNVGKSTLLNQTIGESLVAVSPKAQTTRHAFRGIYNRDSTQIIFIDTPGMHISPQGKILNEAIVEAATNALIGIDLVLYMVDATRKFTPDMEDSDENFIVECLKQVQKKEPTKIGLLINKVDQQEDTSDVEIKLEWLRSQLPIEFVSKICALKDLSGLLDQVTTYLPVHPPYFDTDILSDQSVRSIVREMIQEQLFRQLGAEIPYECVVDIIKFVEASGKKKTEIHAQILVARHSLKGMVIGKGAQKIKSIGTAARSRIEGFLGESVILRLLVKERLGWTKNKQILQKLGFSVTS